MGHNDHPDDEADLPREAGDQEARLFEPDDNWIKGALPKFQIEAMRRWFHTRYEDPANETPYNGRQGGYLYVHGGPYDPRDVISERFEDLVEAEVMERLTDQLLSDVGDEWAPINHDGDEYDEALSMLIFDRIDPYRMLLDRLAHVEAVLTVSGTPEVTQLTTQLAHGAAITALEAYLWDTTTYWVSNSKDVARKFVETNHDFQNSKVPLADIFARLDGLDEELRGYLRDQIWHRLDKIKPMIESALEIQLPAIGELMKHVLVRHDIVHRGGRSKDGNTVIVTSETVRQVKADVAAFAGAIEAEIARRFPIRVIADVMF